ncbi:MAG: putative membrane protein [halophilic archaeon J07HX64]|jgi:Predicted membrane protein|nr:MAG: putative membrane protein [halophilic archaeon J07HX64]
MSGRVVAEFARLDSRSVPYRVAENAVRIVGVILLSVLFGGGGGPDGGQQGGRPPLTLVFIVVGVLAVAGWETAHVRRFTYRATGDTFDIQSGVLSRREREIPFERIQNVDIAQNVVQRAIGISEVRIETAGGGASEARLRYVSESEAARLQELISDRKHGETERDPGDENEVLFELEQRELGILGVTSANFRFFIGIVFLFFLAGGAGARQTEVAPPQPRMQLLLLLGPALAIVALVLLWVVSGVQAVLRYYDFRLLRNGDELRYERGLLQRYNGTIPLSKVQSLMIRENVLARVAGYANLAIETAGYSPGQNGDSVDSAVPIAKRDRVFALADTVEDIDELEFERPPKRARTRYLARYTLIIAAIVAAAAAYHAVTNDLGDWYLAAVLLVGVVPAAHLKWKQLGYYHDDRHFVTRRGFWTRRTTIVPYYRVQTVADSQTVFQQRRDLATLTVDTASSGGSGGDAVALDIDVDIARQLREEVHDQFQDAITRRAELLGEGGSGLSTGSDPSPPGDGRPTVDGGHPQSGPTDGGG